MGLRKGTYDTIVKFFYTLCCSEGHDCDELTLPGKQEDFLLAIRSATKNPMIVVVMSGGPVDLSWAKEMIIKLVQFLIYYNLPSQANADAVLWCGYPG